MADLAFLLPRMPPKLPQSLVYTNVDDANEFCRSFPGPVRYSPLAQSSRYRIQTEADIEQLAALGGSLPLHLTEWVEGRALDAFVVRPEVLFVDQTRSNQRQIFRTRRHALRPDRGWTGVGVLQTFPGSRRGWRLLLLWPGPHSTALPVRHRDPDRGRPGSGARPRYCDGAFIIVVCGIVTDAMVELICARLDDLGYEYVIRPAALPEPNTIDRGDRKKRALRVSVFARGRVDIAELAGVYAR